MFTMIGLVLCVLSKIYELINNSSVSENQIIKPEEKDNQDRKQGPPPRLGLKAASPGAAADEDCNSNTSLAGSQHSVHDELDAHCDNSGYLWFLDYNPIFRDSSCIHTSVLSSVSASYKGISELTSRFEFTSRYNDIARDLDANLAEADMESFRTEDIHALLMTANLPRDAIVDDRSHDSNPRGEMFASISSSLMEKFRFDSSISGDSSVQGEESVGSINTMSICKSELLFSPVKEGGHGVHFSVDSLDCELPTEQDLILTCQANKDNYTIAFEGSLTTYSEDSECAEPAVNQRHDKLGKEDTNIVIDSDERTRRNLELLERCKKLTNKLATSMARSDLGLTTWSKLKKQTSDSPLRRHPSGNNNEDTNDTTNATSEMNNSVIKSQSLPNLYRRKLMSSSIASVALSNSTVDSFTANQRFAGTSTCMKVYDVSQNRSSHGSQHSEPMSTSSTENHTSSDKSNPKQPFNLVKLFMKQKSISNEGIVTMDQLDRSECWPSSSGGESAESMGEQKIENLKAVATERPQIELPKDEPEETSLVYEEIRPIHTYSRVSEEALIEEEEAAETTKLSDSESNLYAVVNKPHFKRTNLNVNSPSKMRLTRKSCSSQSSATSVSISSCSESDGTQITRMNKVIEKEHRDHKSTSTHLESDTIDKSIQTSSMRVSNITQDREVFKVVEQSFLEKLKEGDCEKPVFVLYPNYTLPDISFLNGRPNIYLSPLKVNLSPKSANNKRSKMQVKGKRPFSCNDVEFLKKKGLGHIKDWDSLNFLLPAECRQLLSEMPELMHEIKSNVKEKEGNTTAVSSSSSTATQPSSGYRGSSTMLTDSSAQNSPAPAGNFNPLFVYRYDSATSSEASCPNNDGQRINPSIPKRSLCLADQTRLLKQGELAPPRPPLPKSILRKSMDKTRKTSAQTKRYSMFELDEFLQDPIVCATAVTEQKTKRRSLQEPYYLQNQTQDYRKNNDIAAKRLSQQFLDAAEKDADYNEYYQDEGVGTESSLESGKSNELKYHRPHTPPMPKPRTKKMEYIDFPPPGALISSADLNQLEEFLKQSGFNCQNMDEWDHNQVQKGKNLAEIPICEEGEVSPDEFNSPMTHHGCRLKYDIIDVSQKRALVSNVTDAVEMLIQHFSPATDQAELAFLGDSKQSPACAKIALNALCPALYAIFRDGLKENIETSFGAVNNSVWQMVEATARQGPITKSLNELVLRINSEDAVTEGLVKFNAFILGLLNAQTVDAWVSYVRTRESVLAKHYGPDSLILAGCIGEPRCRALLDTLLASLEPLKLLPFSLDLMFEMRELHRSFKRIESDMRAASRLECSGEEWRPGSAGSCASGNTGNGSGNSGNAGNTGGKFRRLQLKWEMLSNAESPVTPSGETSPAAPRGSKIPRPVSSPVRPQAPSVTSPAKTPQRGIPVPVRKGTSPTTSTPRSASARTAVNTKKPPQPANSSRAPQEKPTRKPVMNKTRPSSANDDKYKSNAKKYPTSRVDGAGIGGGAAPRPSSLPYGRSAPPAAPRRAASSSAARAHSAPASHKYVRTLWHRLPSDSGHLAFNEGERLRLILEVDAQYVLCCRGEQKGLVPRDAVLLEDF
ncbi:serine-rich adhesin for platelets isoform X3 [Battus philenor]|uniref:serine-rich adhesin for platelets isoform X3 n=1 Tax=Battus philenor TaxID=42288 RepID=UPI0035D0ADB4